MHLWITGSTIETPGHLDGRSVGFLVQRQRAGFRIGAQQLDQPGTTLRRWFIRHPATAEAPRKVLGELPDFPFSHTQNLGYLGKGAPCLERREPTDNRTVPSPILAENEIHHVVFAVVGKINVDVRELVQRHPVLVEEAVEVEVEADGADVADPKAVAHQRIGRAATGDPFDALSAALLKNVPDDEKVVLITNVRDDAQLFIDLAFHPGVVVRVSSPQALLDQPAEELG